MYYTSYLRCNELAEPVSMSLRPNNIAPFEKNTPAIAAVSNSVSHFTCRDLNLKPPSPETNAIGNSKLPYGLPSHRRNQGGGGQGARAPPN